ncbi:hypothetical protein H0E87_015884 [Populus deltoides]|uniref:Uncharacterized protein n=1 Tax=Populus deltoides TaxID=3696 RepID=A0A8T2Y6Q4_POPDE|nr:hypothetical protein H0E87_015884 [Populus deltoides]
MYQTLRKLGYFKFTDEFKKSGINNVGYLRYLILRKSSKSGLRLLSDEDCFYEVMKHWRVYGLVHIYAELVPLLVNDLDGSNDCPNREKGQFGQNGGVGLNEGVGETLVRVEYAEDCEVSSATEGMDGLSLRNVWNYLMLQSHSSDDDADVGKEGKLPGYEIDHSASSDPGNYDSSDSEEEDTGIKRSRRSITYDPDNPKWIVGMETNRDSGATSSNKQRSETLMNVLNSSTQSDVHIVGNKREEEQKFSMHQVDQENVKDTGSTVRQASTAAKLNQPAQGSTMHKASQNASWN